MLDGLYDQTAAMKAMWVERAKQEFTGDSHYLRLHGEPLVMLFSTRLDFDVPHVLLRNVYWSYRYDPGENAFNGTLRLEPRDWPFWAPTPQPLANGMVPVIPGYNDAALDTTSPAQRLTTSEQGTCYECELAGDHGRAAVRFRVTTRGGFEPCRL